MPEPVKSLKWYRQLADRKGRLAAGAFTVEGERAVSQIIAAAPASVLEILSVDEPPPFTRPYPWRRLAASEYKYVSSMQTPQGLLAVVSLPDDVESVALPAVPGPRVLLLENIQDPGNAGTLIRTAAALGFNGVMLTDTSADPFSPRCAQAAAGTVLSVWLRRTPSYLEMATELKQQGHKIMAADVQGDAAPAVLKNAAALVLALGNEGAGLSPELLAVADYRLRIETDPAKAESLNVAACGAILMYLAGRG